jgi:hypothetical protein
LSKIISFLEKLIRSSDNICQTFIEFFKTHGNHVNILLANFEAILFENHDIVSDSCKYIFFLKSHQAITTGNDTYHHLQNITSILYIHI